jgi:hypothetical protein
VNTKRAVLLFSLLLVAAGIIGWVLTQPQMTFPAVSETKTTAKPSSAPVSSPPRPSAGPAQPAVDRRVIDAEHLKLADRLAAHSETPLQDLEIVNEFFELYRKTLSHLPVGSNEDLTAILTGSNPLNGVVFPKDSPMIVKGQIVDRWGTPYWIHPNSGARVEIRSAGPDQDLFTSDDLMLNASPGGLGVTPLARQ